MQVAPHIALKEAGQDQAQVTITTKYDDCFWKCS